MIPRDEEGRPAGEPDGINLQAGDLLHSLRHAALERLVSGVDGALVVIVVTPTASTRRRVFLSLAGAQRYAARSLEQGHLVRVVLAHLDAVSEVRL